MKSRSEPDGTTILELPFAATRFILMVDETRASRLLKRRQVVDTLLHGYCLSLQDPPSPALTKFLDDRLGNGGQLKAERISFRHNPSATARS